MDGWLAQTIGQNWLALLVLIANAGGFVVYVKVSVKGLSEKVKAVEEDIGEVKDDVEDELKELRRNIETELKEIKKSASSSADRIVEGFRAALYSRQDGQSIYMPRIACESKSSNCLAHIAEVYNTKVDAVGAKIEGLCQTVRDIKTEILSQKKERE